MHHAYGLTAILFSRAPLLSGRMTTHSCFEAILRAEVANVRLMREALATACLLANRDINGSNEEAVLCLYTGEVKLAMRYRPRQWACPARRRRGFCFGGTFVRAIHVPRTSRSLEIREQQPHVRPSVLYAIGAPCLHPLPTCLRLSIPWWRSTFSPPFRCPGLSRERPAIPVSQDNAHSHALLARTDLLVEICPGLLDDLLPLWHTGHVPGQGTDDRILRGCCLLQCTVLLSIAASV